MSPGEPCIHRPKFAVDAATAVCDRRQNNVRLAWIDEDHCASMQRDLESRVTVALDIQSFT